MKKVSFRPLVADPGEEIELEKWEFIESVVFEEGKFRLIVRKYTPERKKGTKKTRKAK